MSEFNDLEPVSYLLAWFLISVIPFYIVGICFLVLGFVSKNLVYLCCRLAYGDSHVEPAEAIVRVVSEFSVGLVSVAVFPPALLGFVIEDSLPFKPSQSSIVGGCVSALCWLVALYDPVLFLQTITFGQGCGWSTTNCD